MKHHQYILWAILLAVFTIQVTIASESAVWPEYRHDEQPKPRLDGRYAVVVSKVTAETPGWSEVLEVLRAKYEAQVVQYESGKVEEILPELREICPRYVCFLSQPTEVQGDFVARAHRLTRKLDDDPWTDCIWAILTGYEANDAMRNVKEGPLEIRRVLGGTPLLLECADSGVWFSELKKNEKWVKESGKEPVRVEGPDDTTQAIIEELIFGKAQLFITSGHATQNDWMIGFSYRNGFFVSETGGKLAGKDTAGVRHEILSDEPCVHLGVGNCLIGDISDMENCMALGLIHSAGVRQMVGYTVPSWYGYMGWGMLDYFYLQPGRYTVAEAFFANQQALLHRLETASPGVNAAYDRAMEQQPQFVRNLRFTLSPEGQRMQLTPQDITGLLYDRDTVAIYGDPAWDARMADGRNEWTQEITTEPVAGRNAPYGDGREVTYTITLRKTSCDNTDKNGSQRGGRPFFVFLPTRLERSVAGRNKVAPHAGSRVEVEILAGAELEPVIADDFVLIPKFEMEEGKEYSIKFRGKARAVTP